MFSITLLLAFFQLATFVVSASQFQSPRDAAIPNVKRDEAPDYALSGFTTVTSSKKTTTATTTTKRLTTTTTSAASTCTPTFRLVVSPSNSFIFYVYVDPTNNYTVSSTLATTFTLTNNRLVDLSNSKINGFASVAKNTGANGNYIVSSLDTTKFEFLDASFNQYCEVILTKKLSNGVTLDTVYSIYVENEPSRLFIQPSSKPAPSGGQQIPLISYPVN